MHNDGVPAEGSGPRNGLVAVGGCPDDFEVRLGGWQVDLALAEEGVSEARRRFPRCGQVTFRPVARGAFLALSGATRSHLRDNLRGSAARLRRQAADPFVQLHLAPWASGQRTPPAHDLCLTDQARSLYLTP